MTFLAHPDEVFTRHLVISRTSQVVAAGSLAATLGIKCHGSRRLSHLDPASRLWDLQLEGTAAQLQEFSREWYTGEERP